MSAPRLEETPRKDKCTSESDLECTMTGLGSHMKPDLSPHVSNELLWEATFHRKVYPNLNTITMVLWVKREGDSVWVLSPSKSNSDNFDLNFPIVQFMKPSILGV